MNTISHKGPVARHPLTNETLCLVERKCTGIVWGLTRAQADWLRERFRGVPLNDRPIVQFLGRPGRYISSMGHRKLINQAVAIRIGDETVHLWKNGRAEKVT